VAAAAASGVEAAEFGADEAPPASGVTARRGEKESGRERGSVAAVMRVSQARKSADSREDGGVAGGKGSAAPAAMRAPAMK